MNKEITTSEKIAAAAGIPPGSYLEERPDGMFGLLAIYVVKVQGGLSCGVVLERFGTAIYVPGTELFHAAGMLRDEGRGYR